MDLGDHYPSVSVMAEINRREDRDKILCLPSSGGIRMKEALLQVNACQMVVQRPPWNHKGA